MGDVSNKTIVALLAVALVVTVVGTVVSVNKLGQLGGSYSTITGAATDSGTTSLNLAGTAGVTVTNSTVNMGAGYVNTSYLNATFSTNWSDAEWNETIGTWVNTTNPFVGNRSINNDNTTGALVIENTGTVPIQLNISTGTTAEGWLCNGCGSTSARLEVKATVLDEAGCTGNLAGQFTNFLSHNTGNSTGLTLCSEMNFADASDTVAAWFNVTVPNDASSGDHVLTLTITGVDID